MADKRKILMYVFGDITTDARVQRAANALSGDFDVTVLSHDKGKDVEDGAYRNILLKGWSGHSFLTTLGTVWNAYQVVKRERPDCVYCHDYYSSLLCRLLLNKKYCKRIVYDAHELIIPEEGHPMDSRQRIYYKLEKSIVNKVDLVVCASKERGEMMRQHYKLPDNPLTINNISQLANSEDSSTKGIVHSLRDFFAKPGVTVVYAGVVTKSRRIDQLLDAVISLAPMFKLLVVGNGDALGDLRQKAESVPELVSAFTGAVPYKSLGAILSRCDIGFLYYPVDTLNNTYCASNKIYEYSSVGLPMLANENPTIKQILEKSLIGLSNDNFAKGLQMISAESEKYKNNCLLFTQKNQWSEEARKLEEAIRRIIQ